MYQYKNSYIRNKCVGKVYINYIWIYSLCKGSQHFIWIYFVGNVFDITNVFRL